MYFSGFNFPTFGWSWPLKVIDGRAVVSSVSVRHIDIPFRSASAPVQYYIDSTAAHAVTTTMYLNLEVCV